MSENNSQTKKKKNSQSSLSEMSCKENSSDLLLESQCSSKKNKSLLESKKDAIKVKTKRIKQKCAIVKKNSSSLCLKDRKSDKLKGKTLPLNVEPGTPTNSESDSSNSVKLKKRSRRRGRKKNNQKEKYSPLLIDISSKELILNAETLFILNLLYTDSKDRDELILDLAIARNILSFDKKSKSYALHKNIEKLIPHVLLIGNVKLREFNKNTIEKLGSIKSTKKLKIEKNRTQSESANVNKETNKCKYFEDFVNEIVLEGISDDKKPDFIFNYKINGEHPRSENYYNNSHFIDSLEAHVQKCVDANLGMVIEGEIRINEKNNYQSFMRNVDGKRDAFIPSRLARKFAFEGDIVRAFVRNVEYSTPVLNPLLNITTGIDDTIIEDDCREIALDQKAMDLGIISENSSEKNFVAFVIKVIKKVHNRRCVGTFKTNLSKLKYLMFVPRDLKMQTIRIYRSSLPPEILNSNMESIGEILYEVKIDHFSNDLCIGRILHSIGKCGELDSENKAILLQNDIHLVPYDEKFNEMYRTPLIITEKDLAEREDIRKLCIFTIDPFTARDLDDAMSCRKLSEDIYEVGVHISDVSHFIPENSELDNIIKEKTTSIYMVNEVFHMLPKPLCFKCSLLPGEDKFTFSVFWNITTEGEVLSTRFARTIMRSCTQLAYEHAQKVIDNPLQSFDESDFPEITNGFTVDDIVNTINVLQKIASNLRMKRFDNGALRMDRTKLYFELKPETGEPISFSPACLDTANFLIEEFMLLANQCTAQYIYDKYPLHAVLRNHQPPLPNLIKKLKEELLNLNINLDMTSSKSIFTGMEKISNESKHPDVMKVCLSNLISKTMSRARYFCAEEVNGSGSLLHYALSIPIYTHFTSPIRRYPDILVHRVLSAALGYTELPKRPTDELHEICGVCNEMKYKSKIAGEQSSDLYFLHYVKSKIKIIVPAAVLFIGRSTINVISITTGHQFKISYKSTNGKAFKCFVDASKTPLVAYIVNNTDPNKYKITLNVFSVIDIAMQVTKQKLTVAIVNPFACEENKESG